MQVRAKDEVSRGQGATADHPGLARSSAASHPPAVFLRRDRGRLTSTIPIHISTMSKLVAASKLGFDADVPSPSYIWHQKPRS